MENRRALFTLITANIISGFATGISMLAIPWYFTINGHAALFGILYAAVTAASMPWNLYAGTLIDKYSRKTLFIYISAVCGTILLLSATYGFISGTTPLALVGLVFVTTIFNYSIHFGALYAFGQEISSPHFYGKLSSILEIQHQTTSIFSGALAALLLSGIDSARALNFIGAEISLPFNVEPWGMHEIFLLDAVTYSIAIILVSTIRYKPIAERVHESGNVLNRLKTGLAYLREHPGLFRFGVLSHSIFVILLVEVLYLLPVYVDNHLNESADVYASSEILYSMGAMIAGFSIRRIFARFPALKAVIFMMFFSAIILYWVSFTRSVIIFYIFSFFIGITNAGTRVLRITYILNHIPNQIIGRTNGVFNMINIMLRATFIAIFAISWFSEGSNITWAYFISGTFVLTSGLLLAFYGESDSPPERDARGHSARQE
jgi:MFS family permease